MQFNWCPFSALQEFFALHNHVSVSDMMNGIHGYTSSKILEAHIQYDTESTKALDYTKLFFFSLTIEASLPRFCKTW